MSEPSADQSLYLADVLRAAVEARSDRGGAWLSENAVDPVTGERVMSVHSANDLIRNQRVGWVAPHRMRAVAHALEWPHSGVYIPNALSIGLDAPPELGQFAMLIPSWADRFPGSVQAHVLQGIHILGRAHGLTD